MRRLLRTLLPLLALCFAPATLAAAMPELTMFQGETRVLAEPNAGRLAVGNGKVLSAAVLDDREILLIANDVGVSSLHIWTAKGSNRRVKINVVPAETPRVNREIAAFLANIPNARSSVIGDKVVVDCRDDGPGIEPSELERIFEPFFQGSRNSPAATKGSGIGLAIVREFISAHHGSVRALPSERGAHFRIELPHA